MILRPNFSGVWQVDFRKSNLEIKAPTSSMFTIQHEDPLLKLTRTHKADGYEDTFSLALSTDGTECISQKGDVEIRSTCVWRDATLCFQSRFLVEGAKAENVVIYSMSEDGQEIVADETFVGPLMSYHNKWVLVRQAMAN